MKVSLPPGAMSLEMEDGTLYADKSRYDKSRPAVGGKASMRRDRSVQITDPAHLAALAKNQYVGRPYHHVNGTSGWDCQCGHGCWEWQQTCSNCSRPRPAEGSPE